MNLTKLNDNIYLFTSETFKELTLSFFRVQEYYESQNPKLYGKKFDTFKFLKETMNDDGEIDYFSFWAGFNIPGNTFNKFRGSYKEKQFTSYERKMFSQLKDAGIEYTKPFYIIGSIADDKSVIDHEIAHALFHVDSRFYGDMTDLNIKFKFYHPEIFEVLQKQFLRMGYSEKVLDDETQAYMSTESDEELMDNFSIDINKCESIIMEYRKTLKKYNKFKI